jgi:hypothetical protein
VAVQWPPKLSSPQTRLQCPLQLLAHIVQRRRLPGCGFPLGAPGAIRLPGERVVRLRRGHRHPALASGTGGSHGRAPLAAAPDLSVVILHGVPQHHVIHVQQLQLSPHQREHRRLAISWAVRRIHAQRGGVLRSTALPAVHVGVRGLLDGELADDQQRHLADSRERPGRGHRRPRGARTGSSSRSAREALARRDRRVEDECVRGEEEEEIKGGEKRAVGTVRGR